jgi:hypothetical protein
MSIIKIIPETIQLIRLSDEEYFSGKHKEYLSNSKIGLINPDEGGSLDKFQNGFSGDYSDSYALGSAVHCKILQPDDFIISDILKPNGKLGIFSEEVLKNRRKGLKIADSLKQASINANYYSSSFTANRIKTAIKKSIPFYLKRYPILNDKDIIFLSEGLYDKYIGAVNSIQNNNAIMSLLKPEGLLLDPEVYNEYAIFCDIEVETDEGEYIPLKFKAKLDNFTIDEENKVITLNDLKTTGKPISYFMGNNVETEQGLVWWDGSFQKYHYYRQLGVYMWLLQAALQVKFPQYVNYKYKSNIIVVEGFETYKSCYYSISNNMIKKGLQEFKRLMLYIAEWKKYQN